LFHLVYNVAFLQLQWLWPKVYWHALSIVRNRVTTVYFLLCRSKKSRVDGR
jgi:hypothetical protein